MADCGCLYIKTQSFLDVPFEDGEYFPAGTFNGCSYYEFIVEGVAVFLYFDGNNQWEIAEELGAVPDEVLMTYDLDLDIEQCPLGLSANWFSPNGWRYYVMTTNCDNPFLQCCFNQTMTFNGGAPDIVIEQTFQNATGFFNGKPYWGWCSEVEGTQVGFNLFAEVDELDQCIWTVEQTKCGANPSPNPIDTLFEIVGTCGCPISNGEQWTIVNPNEDISGFSTEACIVICEPIEDRHFRKFDSIKLPEVFEEQDRGFKICCDCPMLVLGGGTETWENDVTSAWIKLSAPSDSATFSLKKDGVISSYTPLVYEFPNEPNAFYTTIPWTDVLSQDGIGCYTLSIEYNISGIIGELMWGQYNLKPYSIDNALETARIRVKYNLQQEIEGINFTGANVEDCIRFNGFIGDRQPNMEIDNLTYQNRVVKTVVRENLDTFTIKTDPLLECFISPMCNLFLLSENEMWISDYNAHNHSYRINDIPVVVQETPEIDYLDQFQRRAILTCLVGLRSKNRRTHY